MTEQTPQLVCLALHAVHPDTGDVPSTAVFALRLLMDAPPRGPYPEHDPAADPETAMRQLAEHAIASVVVTDRRNFPFDEQATAQQIDDRVRADDGQQALAREWAAFWADPQRAPSATVAIRLRPDSTLALPATGTEWDSAAYG
ncbi:hypothetical protein ACIRYZ_36375 [Kitasatospora sp. NPDC101155]|uniref:hypothetical protein n=1 Tax=Kitasatospora sp. NPDC101155 TaxID=3364097 RepID=UPI00381B96DB